MYFNFLKFFIGCRYMRQPEKYEKYFLNNLLKKFIKTYKQYINKEKCCLFIDNT